MAVGSFQCRGDGGVPFAGGRIDIGGVAPFDRHQHRQFRIADFQVFAGPVSFLPGGEAVHQDIAAEPAGTKRLSQLFADCLHTRPVDQGYEGVAGVGKLGAIHPLQAGFPAPQRQADFTLHKAGEVFTVSSLIEIAGKQDLILPFEADPTGNRINLGLESRQLLEPCQHQEMFLGNRFGRGGIKFRVLEHQAPVTVEGQFATCFQPHGGQGFRTQTFNRIAMNLCNLCHGANFDLDQSEPQEIPFVLAVFTTRHNIRYGPVASSGTGSGETPCRHKLTGWT